MWHSIIKNGLKGFSINTIGSIAIVIVLTGLLWHFATGFTASYNKGDGGIVIVDSPEVYSRERLINDRFRQVSWLENELENSDAQFFGNQAISDYRQILGVESKIGVANSAGDGDTAEATTAGDGSAGVQAGNGANRTNDLSVSPNERFRDVLAYREEIRTEMMETLLDDRHDIKGNTLYRLKFDTTILPEDNTEKLVVIQVVLAKADLCKDDDGEATSAVANIPCMSVDTIHAEWVKQTELKINKAMEGTINYIRAMNLPSTDFADFVRFLQGNRPSMTDIAPDMGFEIESDKLKRTRILRATENVKKWDRLVELDGQCLSQLPPLEAGGKYTERQLISCYRNAYTFYLPQAYRGNSVRYNKFRDLLHHYYAKELSSTRPYEDFIAAHTNYMELSRLQNPVNPVGNEFMEYIKRAETAELALLRNVVAIYYIDKYTYSDIYKTDACNKFYRNKLTVFEDKSLSCLAHLEKTTCHDVEHCAVRATAKVPLARRRLGCGLDDDPEKDQCLTKKIRDRFEELLEYGEAYYSYAITPKERAQRVLSIVSERRQKQLALSLIAKSSDSLDPKTIESLTRVITESNSNIEQIQRKPLILSFGRGQPVSTVDEKDVLAKGIDFGWIVGPKYLVSGDSDGRVGFVHAPVQYSLSAVISVPSWWTAVKLEIDACWIEQNEISQIERGVGQAADGTKISTTYIDNICHSEAVESSYNNDVSYIVRLPGTPAELPRKFGYEIERAPSIQNTRNNQYLADFYIGQEKASLIINGDELWRSTVVTMGNQKADNIEVLPNMKGIIATFDTVNIPDQKINSQPAQSAGRSANRQFESCVVSSRVVVWTSEGKTELPLYVRIHPNPDKKYPKGFGGCDDEVSVETNDNRNPEDTNGPA